MAIPRKQPISKTAIYNKFGGQCAYCGKPLPKYGWHRDHVDPIIRYRGVRYSFSGRNGCKNPEAHTADNIVAACKPCNLSKANLDLETWRGSLRWFGWREGIVFWMEKYERG